MTEIREPCLGTWSFAFISLNHCVLHACDDMPASAPGTLPDTLPLFGISPVMWWAIDVEEALRGSPPAAPASSDHGDAKGWVAQLVDRVNSVALKRVGPIFEHTIEVRYAYRTYTRDGRWKAGDNARIRSRAARGREVLQTKLHVTTCDGPLSAEESRRRFRMCEDLGLIRTIHKGPVPWWPADRWSPVEED